MMYEPRTLAEYGGRETEAAHRVLVDVGQVLAAYFTDSIVVVGGWVPELLLHGATPPHSGSIDVDLALDAEKLLDGRYAEIVESLLTTGRYKKTEKTFTLQATVDLGDGGPVVVVDVDFLKPPGKIGRGSGSRLLPGFRPLDADGCAAAFMNPTKLEIGGKMISGAENVVHVLVASVSDFLIMKAHALANRDKPKDAYDICYCLDHMLGGMEEIAGSWRGRLADKLVANAIRLLREKFLSAQSYGPRQVVEFYAPATRDEVDVEAQRAYQLVARFLRLIDGIEG